MEQEQTTICLLTELKKQDDRISQLEKTVEQIIAVLNGERINPFAQVAPKHHSEPS